MKKKEIILKGHSGPQPPNLGGLSSENILRMVNEALDALPYDRRPASLYEPVKYVLSLGGKRIRPVLMLLAYNLYKDNPADIMMQALALETYHNYTLLHDDLMDNADLRRGHETVHKRWDANTAILTGDSMLVLAYQRMQQCPKENLQAVMDVFTETALEIGEGQQYDMDFETQRVVTIPEYMEMIRLKTAVLLATSLQMGAMIAGADEEDQKHLYDFGIALGLAFQLQDDVLDCYSDVAVFGKVTGGDIVENKKTMMYLKTLELASPDERERLEALFSGEIDINTQRKIDEVIALYDKLNVREFLERLMADYFRQATACLDAVKLPEERKVHLRHYADLLSGREK